MTNQPVIIEQTPEAQAPPSNEPETEMEVEEAQAVADDEAAKAAAEQPESAEPAEGDDSDDLDGGNEPAGEADQGEPETEFFDHEVDGKSYKLPVALQKSFMLESDYTQKSQANADLRRSLDQEKIEIDQSRQVSGEEMGARAHLVNINQQLVEYGKFTQADWNAFEMNDPSGAASAFRQQQTLENQKAQAENYLAQAEQTRTETAKQETATRLDVTREFAKTNIKGWTPELDKQVEEHAIKELGFTQETLIGAYSPEVYRTLHLAMLGSQFEKRQSAPPPKKKGPPIKPLQKVAAKGGSAARKTMAEMSMEEYAEHRNRQEAAQRKRATR